MTRCHKLTNMLIIVFYIWSAILLTSCAGGMLHIKQNIPKRVVPRPVIVQEGDDNVLRIEGGSVDNVLQNWIDIWEDDLRLRKLLGE